MGHVVSSRSYWWDMVWIVNKKIVGKYRAFSFIFIPMYNFCYVENPLPFVDFQVYSYIGSEKQQRLLVVTCNLICFVRGIFEAIDCIFSTASCYHLFFL